MVVATFQSSSTALTVTLNAVPAVRTDGVPVLPPVVPGAAVSPGGSSCNFMKGPESTGVVELVSAVLDASVKSLAVTVRDPEVLSVTLKLCVPETKAALDGRSAWLSEELRLTVCVAELTRFQLASTAL